MAVLSPVTGKPNVKLVSKIDIAALQANYQKENIDVKKYFDNDDELSLYECQDSKLHFFYPFDVVGDDAFYQDLQNFEWYYVQDKWEFRQGISLIPKGQRVLEIGSGRGQFLKLCTESSIDITGLEINTDTYEKMKAAGYKVRLATLQDFESELNSGNDASVNNQRFDTVCSFQVFEHLTDIGNVMQSAINLLKPGGQLIISVPNSACLYNNVTVNPFNAPPHHQSLWYEETFIHLANLYNLKLNKIFLEPPTPLSFFRMIPVLRKVIFLEKGEHISYIKAIQTLFSMKSVRVGRTMLASFTKKEL